MTIPEPATLAELTAHLEFLYPGRSAGLAPTFEALVSRWRDRMPAPSDRQLSARDSVLICYGDQVTTPGQAPLATLASFLGRFRADFSAVHLLPFFPYSSDDGFSVIDYRTVRRDWGDWSDIATVGEQFDLMLDAVVNHVSAQGSWFQSFLAGEPPYDRYFITVEPEVDLSTVVRPRTTPLLTPVETANGTRLVWTTFSADQVDLDYGNPEVLLEMSAVLLEYAARGARFLRLDAVTYLWKQPGTPSVHDPRTHRVIQFWRTLFDCVAPDVVLVTETNVPHAENIAYFGDGHNEAQLVYNFALPPLLLHTIGTGDAGALTRWAGSLTAPTEGTAFLNFLASHDGIGVRGVEGILTPAEVATVVARVETHGGLVGRMAGPDGGTRIYELNINLYDALNDPATDDPQAVQVARFLAAHAIMLSLPGVPAIYLHSLLGSRGDSAGVARTGQNRSINREKLDLVTLESELVSPYGRRGQVLAGLRHLLRTRAAEPAFAPGCAATVLDLGRSLFALERRRSDGARVVCVHSIVGHPQTVHLPDSGTDLLTGRTVGPRLELPGYAVAWIAS